jgi:hypothetical protein
MRSSLRRIAIAAGLAVAAPLATAHAQAPLPVGSKLLNVGLFADGGTGLGASLEVGVAELAPRISLGLGGTIGFWSNSGPGFNVTSIPVLANANVHVGLPDLPALDLFAGAALGIIRYSVDYDGAGPGPGNGRRDDGETDTAFGINLGARYEFTSKVGGVVQLGVGDIPELFLGVSFKF